jgi:hypothetical protein
MDILQPLFLHLALKAGAASVTILCACITLACQCGPARETPIVPERSSLLPISADNTPSHRNILVRTPIIRDFGGC